jgi:hypothetical protein
MASTLSSYLLHQKKISCILRMSVSMECTLFLEGDTSIRHT